MVRTSANFIQISTHFLLTIFLYPSRLGPRRNQLLIE